MSKDNLTAPEILNMLNKEDLIQSITHRFLINQKQAALIVIEELSNKQIKLLNKEPQTSKLKKPKNVSEMLAILDNYDKDNRMYEKLQKKINQLEKLVYKENYD